MSKLKTLNDFNDIGATTDEMNLDHENLKREAIKELKLIEDNRSIDTKRDLSWCKTSVGAYIAWKNNLIEEDLK